MKVNGYLYMHVLIAFNLPINFCNLTVELSMNPQVLKLMLLCLVGTDNDIDLTENAIF